MWPVARDTMLQIEHYAPSFICIFAPCGHCGLAAEQHIANDDVVSCNFHACESQTLAREELGTRRYCKPNGVMRSQLSCAGQEFMVLRLK